MNNMPVGERSIVDTNTFVVRQHQPVCVGATRRKPRWCSVQPRRLNRSTSSAHQAHHASELYPASGCRAHGLPRARAGQLLLPSPLPLSFSFSSRLGPACRRLRPGAASARRPARVSHHSKNVSAGGRGPHTGMTVARVWNQTLPAY